MAEPPPSVAPAAPPAALSVIQRKPLSRQYKLGLCVVAVFMLLLPALYLALAAALAYGVCCYASANSAMLDSKYFYSQVLYLVPLIAGCVLVVFMLKPLAFKFWGRERGVELRRQDAPEFHAFVERIAGALNVPPPRTVWIDLSPNAGARFRRDVFSLRSEPILIIGVPLLLELNTRQLAGVIAHEICHLSQRTAMRLTWIIRSVNYWFAYAVHGPHVVEEFLNWSSELGPLSVVFYTARLFVWIARSILKGLLVCGHSVSCYMLRQMELDADASAAHIAGGRTFEEVLARLEALVSAGPFVDEDLEFASRNKLLPDDVTPLFGANLNYAAPAGFRSVAHINLGGFHKYMRTHPPDEERAEHCRREADAGIVRDESPAISVFKDFSAVSKKFTRDWYRLCAGRSVNSADCFPELSRRLGKDRESAAAFERYFSQPAATLRPFPLKTLEPLEKNAAQLAADLEPTVRQLKDFRQRGQDEAAAWRSNSEGYRAASAADVKARMNAALGEHNLSATVPKANAVAAQTALQNAETALSPFETHAIERLVLALALLQQKRVVLDQKQFPDAGVARMLATLSVLSPLMPQFVDFRADHVVSLELCAQLSTRMRLKKAAKILHPRLQTTLERLKEFHKALGTAPYPFDYFRPDTALRRYVLPDLPDKPDLRVIGASDDLLLRIFPIYFSILSRCALLAEQIEAHLDPAPPPPSTP